MKVVKKILLLFVLLIAIIPIVNIFATTSEDNQIDYAGGETVNPTDGVIVSKRIEKTSLENYFDIILTVETTSVIEDTVSPQDLAVVLVLDISNTMNEAFSKTSTDSTKKIDAAKSSVKDFIDKFYENSLGVDAVRQIGLVTFNRDSYDKFGGLKDVSTTDKDTLTGLVSDIVAPDNVDVKWTNMQAGLEYANNLLKGTSVKNKYVIFLTDGLPTTYTESGYTGYNPMNVKSENVKSYVEGNFYNYEMNKAIVTQSWAGTNYSEWGARKAEQVAYDMKNDGIKIYSIGVGMTTQYTMYHFQHNGFSYTVDTDKEEGNYLYTSLNTYKMPRYYTILPKVNMPSKDATSNDEIKKLYDNTEYYKVWLSEYIGSDDINTDKRKYYYDSDDKEALERAYDEIFEDIRGMTSEEVDASWVARDPMNASGTNSYIEFVGMYDDKGILKKSLNKGDLNESDTASYNETSDTISWDLKKSESSVREEEVGNQRVTYYTYEIRYKVRLENESEGFSTDSIYNTNGETYLDYVVLVKKDGVDVRTELKRIQFEIPRVIGYFGSLSFDKVSNYNDIPLSGISFRLVHDSDCPCLKEDEHMSEGYYMEAISDENGKVVFNDIPSGHSYMLYEKETDTYHEVNETRYDVVVSYGKTTTGIVDNRVVNNYKSNNLTIEKEVKGIKTTKDFSFELSATYKGSPLVGTYEVVNGEKSYNVEFIDGKIGFTLKSGDVIVINGLPYGTKYIIKENDTNGFVVKYRIDDNDIKIYENGLEEDLLKDTNVLFINSSGYELPATGSSGKLISIIMGLLLLIGPVIYIGYNFRMKGKADFQ